MSSHPPFSPHRQEAPALLAGEDLAPPWSSTWSWAAALAATILVGLLARLSRLRVTSLWYDEFLTVRTIRMDWQPVLLGRYPDELHPPLYFAALKLWASIVGESELNLRLFSLLAALVSIGLIYVVGRAIGDRRVGLAAAVLLAFQRGFIYYSTEIRMYSLLICLSLVAVAAFIAYQTGRARGRLLLAALFASTLAVTYTHYFGLLLPAGMLAFCLYRRLVQQDTRQNGAIVALVLALLLFIPCAVAILRPQIAFYRSAFQGADYQRLGASTPLAILSWSGNIAVFTPSITSILTLASALCGALLLYRFAKPALAVFMLAFVLASSLVVILASWYGLNVVSRYMLHVALFSLLLAAGACLRGRGRLALAINALGACLLVAFAIDGASFALSGARLHPDWRGVAAAVRADQAPGEPVIILGWDALPVGYYLGPAQPIMIGPDVEQRARSTSGRPSYLVIESEVSGRPAFLSQASVLYEAPEDRARLLRWVPSR